MQPDLDSVKAKIEANRDLVDRIFLKIPGFKGYVERSEKYDADRLIRGFMVDKLQGYKTIINRISGDLLKAGAADLLPEIESLTTNLERILKKVQFAESLSFAAHGKAQIKDEDHARLLEYDWRLISDLSVYDDSVAALASLKQGEGASIRELRDKFIAFEKSFDERKNVLMEVI